MKNILLPLLFCFLFTWIFPNENLAQNYDAQNINLLGFWNDTTIPAESYYGIRYSGNFGWENPIDGRKYAIIGTSRSTIFLEITNPTQPTFRWEIAGRRDHCIWRELKTYKNYLYMVSDDNYPNSLQIADLSYLPDSVHLVMDSDSIFARTHTIFVDGDKLYCGCVKTAPPNTNFSSMNVYSLQNPAKPLLLRRLDEDFSLTNNQVHDMWVRNDTVFASCGYDGLSILKYIAQSNKFIHLSTLAAYPSAGYNHSSTWTKDGKTLVMTDEVPKALPAKVVDVSNPNEPIIRSFFQSSDSATPHNVYFIGESKICVVAHYEDGTQVYSIADPSNPVRLGYFDTHYQTTPATNHGDYAGNWGSYVDFGGGLVVSSDMQNGVFILDISPCTASIETDEEKLVKVWPNPTQDFLYFSPNIVPRIIDWEMVSMVGKLVLAGNNWLQTGLDISLLDRGNYLLTAKTKSKTLHFRIVKN